MHRSIESLCCIPGNNSIAGELFFKNKFIEEIPFVVMRGRRRYERRIRIKVCELPVIS